MSDDEYRDFCAANALTGLIAHTEEDEEIRYQFRKLALEAFRAAEVMVEVRRERYGQRDG